MADLSRERLEKRCERALVTLCQTHARLGNRVTVRVVESRVIVTTKNYIGRGRAVRLVTGKKSSALTPESAASDGEGRP